MQFAWLFRFLILFVSFWALSVQAAPWKKSEPVKAELLTQFTSVKPGTSFEAGVLLTQEPGWHTYWSTPGETGLPTSIDWSLPENWKAGPIQWPTPKLFVQGDITNFGYEDKVLLPAAISVPENAPEGSYTLKASVSWLMCAEQCIPGSAELEIPVKVSPSEPTPSPSTGLFLNNEILKPTALETYSAVYDDKTRAIAVTFKSNKPFNHFYVFSEGEEAVNYGAPQSVSNKEGLITVRLQGTDQIKVGDTFSGIFAADGGPAEGGWAGSFSAAVSAGTVAPPTREESNSDVNITLWMAVGMAFLGGLILNLMPCVFPVLSLKMLNLVEHRKDGHLALHGIAFTVGVLMSMVLLAGLLISVKAAGASLGWGFQLQSPWFVALLAFLFVAITLNLLGAFEFSGVRVASGRGSGQSLGGSFATGILAVVVASPCTAPFMGAALGYALSVSSLESMAVFLGLGVGMSLPWLLLSVCPILTAWLPRPGRWMVIFRTLMSIPMGLTALWLFWVLSQQVSSVGLALYVCGAALLAAALWLYGRKQFGAQIPGAFIALSLFVCAAIYGVAASPLFSPEKVETTAHNDASWSAQAVQEALDKGQPVFVDFTASWCVTCQANKLAVLDREAVRSAFKEKNVQFLIADWTNRNPEISQTLESFGRSGVPLYLLYKPDGSVKVLPELLTTDIVLDSLKEITPKK